MDAPQTYDQIVRAWQNENVCRAAALNKGQPLYGPQQYSESDFVDYMLGNLGRRAQASMAQTGKIDGADAGVQAHYASHRTDFPGPWTRSGSR